MNKSKLVIIQPALGRYRKGFIDSLVSLSDDEFDISIICSEIDNAGVRSMDKIAPEINYTFVKMSSFIKFFFWQHLFFKVLRMNLCKHDSLVINGNPRFLSSIITSLLLKFKGVKVYWWGHAWSSTSSNFGSFIRFKLMNLYNVIFYTDEEVELTKKFIKSDVIALNNGLDVKAMRRGVVFDKNRFDFKVFKIAFIGRYTKKSNFDLLIEAMLELAPDILDSIELNIIGDVPKKDILQKYPDSKKINLKYHGEIWDESEISNILKDNHAFVYPGSVGLSIIHAFALGLPAIVHDERMLHMPEIGAFENEVNGISFRFGSSSSLASKIVHLKNNINDLKKYSKNASSRVDKTYNTEDMALRFINFIRNK